MAVNLGIASSLAVLTSVLGGIKIAGCLFSLYQLDASRRAWRGFSRHEMSAWVLTGIDLCWAAWLVLHTPPFSGMPRIEPMVYVATPLAFFVIVVFLDELLAARALGGLLLLLAAPVLAAARANPSPFSVIMTVAAYAWVVAGMVWVVSPYLLRQALATLTHDRKRYRVYNLAGLGAGGAMLLLALVLY
jgi:hypothetical protein